MTTEQKNDSEVQNFFWLLVYSPVLTGIGLFCYQVYIWLRTGEWTAYSVLYGLSYFDNLKEWVVYPTSWIGIHKLLDKIPLSLFLIVVWCCLFFVVISIINEIREQKKSE